MIINTFEVEVTTGGGEDWKRKSIKINLLIKNKYVSMFIASQFYYGNNSENAPTTICF